MLTTVLAIGCMFGAILFALVALVVINSIRDGFIGPVKPRPQLEEPDIETVLRQKEKARKAEEVRDWDRQFRALLPPEPPCTSDEHDHEEIITFGGQVVARICGTVRW